MAHSALHAAVQPFCVWTGGSRNFAIHLRPDVIERLGTESWMAFKRVPGRGLEIGGILLGRVETSGDSTTFWVDGFQPVESEYRSGPSYLLSELDLEQLRQKIGKQGSESIGIFRSQTRSEQLSLAETDVEVIDLLLRVRRCSLLTLRAGARHGRFLRSGRRGTTAGSRICSGVVPGDNESAATP